MTHSHFIIRLMFAAVWWVNGLYCKVLDLVPRHQEIVAHILGDGNARTLTVLIGLGETAFGCWIFSGRKWRLSCGLQITGVLAMNVVEFLAARELLLFGTWNIWIALIYCLLVFWAGIAWNPRRRHEKPTPV